MPARNTIEVRITARDDASSVIRGIGSRLQDIGATAVVGLAALTAAAGAAAAGIAALAVEAASFGGIREAFEGMAEAAGRDADEFLAALQRGSAGMIDMETLMLKANLATQLVGDQFANQLPQALEYLSKVASATGEDMGFLMDSLVRGVGRLSPMILDNLGIQVDLNAAYETYAASIGKSVDELTKQEQQTALMNAVMAALAENTAAMPDIMMQTDTRLARLQATFKDFRLEIGDRLQPVLDQLITWGEGFIGILRLLVLGDYTGVLYDVFGPLFAEDAPGSAALFAIRDLIQAVLAGVPIFDALSQAISDVMVSADDYGLEGLFQTLQKLNEIVVNILKPIGDWISENFRLSDILIALGIAIGAFLIPVILGILSAAAPLIILFGALVVAVAAIRQAWEEDWGGIRTFIEGTILPLFQDFQGTLSRAGEAAQKLVQIGLVLLVDGLNRAADAADKLLKIGLFVVVDTLNRAAIAAGMLWAMFQLFVISALNSAKEAALEFIGSLDPDAVAGVVIGIALIGGVLLVHDLYGKFQAIATAIRAAAVAGIGLNIALSPLTLVILTIAGIIALYSTNFAGFRDRVNEFGDTLRRGITALGQLFFIIMTTVVRAVQSVIDRIQALVIAVNDAIQRIRELLGLQQQATDFGMTGLNPTGIASLPLGGQPGGGTGGNIIQGFLAALFGQRAFGGPVMGGSPYIVGERGPEVFVPGSSGQIVPNSQLGGSTFNFYFQGSGGPRDEREAEDSAFLMVGALRTRGVEV